MKIPKMTVASKQSQSIFVADSVQYAPTRWLIMSGVVLMAAIAIVATVTIENFRENAIDTAKQGLKGAVVLLAHHFDQQFCDFAILQNKIADELQGYAISQPDVFKSEMGTLAIHEILQARVAGWEDLTGINLFDSKGVLINSSQTWPVADINVSDRAYFKRLAADLTAPLAIDVVQSRFANAFSIVFAKTILGPHGEFLGVLTRAARPEALEAFFGSVGLDPTSTIALHRRDGFLLARFPHVEDMIGRNFKQGPPEQVAVFEQSQFIGHLRSPMDGKDRLIAAQILGSTPLVIVATITMDSTLAVWRSQTKFFISMAGLSILVTTLMLYLIFHQMMRQHRASQQQLAVEKQRLETAVGNMSQGLLLFDSFEKLIVCNQRYIEMYGLSPEIVRPGCSFRDLLRHRKDSGSFIGDVELYCDDILLNNRHTSTAVIDTSDGRLIQIKNDPIPGGGWLATHDDVTDRIRAEEKISHLAHFDSLTDLPNRVSFREHLEAAFSKSKTNDQFAVLYIDIDEFKSINDTLGHHVGDELLKSLASRLIECVGPKDLVARLGGDEFAIVKAEVGDSTELMAFVDNVHREIRRPVNCFGQKIMTDASIGIAIAPDDGSSLDQLIINADLAMYEAKNGGRHTFRFFKPEMGTRLSARRDLETDIRKAIESDNLEIHYQPLVDLASDIITGCEALLRWKHPLRGMVSPAHFIPIAEETGLIIELGDWVLGKACADAANWPEHVTLAVNVSPVQFKSKTLALKVASALARSGLSPQRLELEITEAVLIRDDEEALATLHQLRQLGVRISLDDFGTGYSSLSYLQRFPFDKIKIDRSFVKNLCEAEGSFPIVQAVITMAKARRMSTTAEGVETEAQRDLLREIGCTQMQGFLFSPAVSHTQIKELLSGLVLSRSVKLA